ncbi:class ii aldolase adducin-like protein [Moniliophthora roreri]|nr:class ii aldolase adducin-like protein [Moniliophthora roreri]
MEPFFLSSTMILSQILCLAFTTLLASAAPSSNVTQAARDLVDGNHILHFLQVFDAFGHMSVRDPDNSSQLIMPLPKAPALVNAEDLVTYDISGAIPLHMTFNESITGDAIPPSAGERFISSQMYAKYPDINAVVHSHTLDVLPFADVGVGLRAMMGVAGSLGSLTNGTPIFDYEKLPPNVLPEDAPHDLIIRNVVLGDALAEMFEDGCAVVLMRGHGMAIRAPSIKQAVFRAYNTKQSAKVQLQVASLGGSGWLTPRQADDAAKTNEGDAPLNQAWSLWVEQVKADGLYVNDLSDQ